MWKLEIPKLDSMGGWFIKDNHYRHWFIVNSFMSGNNIKRAEKHLMRMNSSIDKEAVFKGILYGPHELANVYIAKYEFNGHVSIMQNVTIGSVVLDRGFNKGVAKGNLFVGAGAFISADACIGENVIVGANATITKDVPSNCIVVGINRIIQLEEIEMLKRPEWNFIDKFTKVS